MRIKSLTPNYKIIKWHAYKLINVLYTVQISRQLFFVLLKLKYWMSFWMLAPLAIAQRQWRHWRRRKKCAILKWWRCWKFYKFASTFICAYGKYVTMNLISFVGRSKLFLASCAMRLPNTRLDTGESGKHLIKKFRENFYCLNFESFSSFVCVRLVLILLPPFPSSSSLERYLFNSFASVSHNLAIQ